MNERMKQYENGFWDCFAWITSAFFGKRIYSRLSNGLVHSLYSNSTMTKEEAYLEFADYLNEKEMEAME